MMKNIIIISILLFSGVAFAGPRKMLCGTSMYVTLPDGFTYGNGACVSQADKNDNPCNRGSYWTDARMSYVRTLRCEGSFLEYKYCSTYELKKGSCGYATNYIMIDPDEPGSYPNDVAIQLEYENDGEFESVCVSTENDADFLKGTERTRNEICHTESAYSEITAEYKNTYIIPNYGSGLILHYSGDGTHDCPNSSYPHPWVVIDYNVLGYCFIADASTELDFSGIYQRLEAQNVLLTEIEGNANSSNGLLDEVAEYSADSKQLIEEIGDAKRDQKEILEEIKQKLEEEENYTPPVVPSGDGESFQSEQEAELDQNVSDINSQLENSGDNALSLQETSGLPTYSLPCGLFGDLTIDFSKYQSPLEKAGDVFVIMALVVFCFILIG